jgi:hypothetical protein
VYPVVHEAGHILALVTFGAYDPSTTRLLPVGGLPHVGGKLSFHPAPWQTAVAAIAGPVLPTLLGYFSFAVWLSPLGRRWRERHLRMDMGWCMLTLVLVVPQAVPAPLLFPSLVTDRNYSLFIENVGRSLWIANSALAVVALVNLAIVVWLMKHVVSCVRTVRDARREQVASKTPSSS